MAARSFALTTAAGHRGATDADVEDDRGWSLRALAGPLSIESELTPYGPIAFENATFARGSRSKWIPLRLVSAQRGATSVVGDRGPSAPVPRSSCAMPRSDFAMPQGDRRRPIAASSRFSRPARLQLSECLAIDVEPDAAGAPQGRAVDAILRLERRVTERTWMFAGARVLEGGADNEEVNTFATFAYLVGGVRVT